MPQEFTNEEAKLFLERITPNKDYLYIFQPMGLAAILCAGGLSYAAQEKRSKKSTVLIVHESKADFGLKYKNVEKISYIAPQILNAIKKYLDDNEIHETDNFIYGYFDANDTKIFTVAEGLNWLDYYKKKIFDIPMDTPFHPPIITPLSEEEIDYWNHQYILDKERTIILSASQNLKSAEELDFWNKLIKKLSEKNYIVYTYLEYSTQKPFQNTSPLFANISELSYISNNAKSFISSNIGISFFLAMTTDTNIFFLNEFPAWVLNINQMFPRSKSHIFYMAYNQMKAIIEACAKDCVISQIKFSHPKINSEDIFYSYEDILENILETVEKI